MKKSILLTLILTLTLINAANAQNFGRLEALAGSLRSQADDLVARTGKLIKKDGPHSSKEIENAFLAEQLRASTALIQRIISERFHSSEIRYAGMVLHDLSERFPDAGPGSLEWILARDTVEEMSREMRGINRGLSIENAGFSDAKGAILGSVVWSGMVDADVLLSVKGRKISSKTRSGKEYADGTYAFSDRLPQESRIRVGVRVKHGRGKVHVVEQPARNNDYTATIEIRDDASGAKPYALEIYWFRK